MSAQRIVNGAPNGTGPTIAAFEAATPKIRTGMVKGSDQDRQQQAAAPDPDGESGADDADEGQRRRSREQG